MVAKNKTKKFIFSPRRRKKPTQRPDRKYHFCFSAVESANDSALAETIQKVLKRKDFQNSVLRISEQHYWFDSVDSDKLFHIDFYGTEWTTSEIDVVYAAVRKELRDKHIYYAFTDYREGTPEEEQERETNDDSQD